MCCLIDSYGMSQICITEIVSHHSWPGLIAFPKRRVDIGYLVLQVGRKKLAQQSINSHSLSLSLSLSVASKHKLELLFTGIYFLLCVQSNARLEFGCLEKRRKRRRMMMMMMMSGF